MKNLSELNKEFKNLNNSYKRIDKVMNNSKSETESWELSLKLEEIQVKISLISGIMEEMEQR